MDGIQYCRDKVAPLGSNAYYCLLWLPPAEAGGVLAALALRQELLDLPEKVSDGQLALTKLNWWRDELRRTAGGVAQHPVSQVLRPVLQSRPQLSAGMASMCDGIDMLLQTGRINDEAAFGLMNQRLGGCAWQLAVELAGAQEPAELRFAAEAGHEPLHILGCAEGIDDHPSGVVAHPAADAAGDCELVDPGAESDSLHDSANLDVDAASGHD